MRLKWKFFLVLSAVVAVACTKEWSGKKQGGQRLKGDRPDNKAVYASEWTMLNQWKKDKGGFFTEKPIQHPNGNGKVLLFARKLWAADQDMDTSDMPLQLPLQFLPYTDQPGLTETWDYELGTDKLRVNLEITGVAQPEPREIAVRYVVVPQPVWDEIAANDPEVASLPYEDLVAKLDIKP